MCYLDWGQIHKAFFLVSFQQASFQMGILQLPNSSPHPTNHGAALEGCNKMQSLTLVMLTESWAFESSGWEETESDNAEPHAPDAAWAIINAKDHLQFIEPNL